MADDANASILFVKGLIFFLLKTNKKTPSLLRAFIIKNIFSLKK